MAERDYLAEVRSALARSAPEVPFNIQGVENLYPAGFSNPERLSQSPFNEQDLIDIKRNQGRLTGGDEGRDISRRALGQDKVRSLTRPWSSGMSDRDIYDIKQRVPEGSILFGRPEGVGLYNPNDPDISNRLIAYIQSKPSETTSLGKVPDVEIGTRAWAKQQYADLQKENASEKVKYQKDVDRRKEIIKIASETKQPWSVVETALRAKGLDKLKDEPPKDKELPKDIMEMLKEDSPFTAPSIKDYTSESIKVFMQTKNPGDLIPREENGEYARKLVSEIAKDAAARQKDLLARYNPAFGNVTLMSDFAKIIADNPAIVTQALDKMVASGEEGNLDRIRYNHYQELVDAGSGFKKPLSEIPEEPLLRSSGRGIPRGTPRGTPLTKEQISQLSPAEIRYRLQTGDL